VIAETKSARRLLAILSHIHVYIALTLAVRRLVAATPGPRAWGRGYRRTSFANSTQTKGGLVRRPRK
jgi:hypothetical protein